MTPTLATLQAALTTLYDQLGPLQMRPLPARERRALGGRCFRDARAVVLAVARGLGAGAALFPDVRLGGAALAEAQLRADAWLRLRLALAQLAELANDEYLRAQGQAAGDATAVLLQVERTAQLAFPVPLPPAEERAAALGEARALYARHRRRLGARRAGAGTGPATPLAATPAEAGAEAEAATRPAGGGR